MTVIMRGLRAGLVALGASVVGVGIQRVLSGQQVTPDTGQGHHQESRSHMLHSRHSTLLLLVAVVHNGQLEQHYKLINQTISTTLFSGR